MTYKIKSQDGMNKFINSFAETLYDLYNDDVYDDDELYFEDFGLNVNKVNEYYEDDYPRERFDKEQERQKKDE